MCVREEWEELDRMEAISCFLWRKGRNRYRCFVKSILPEESGVHRSRERRVKTDRS